MMDRRAFVSGITLGLLAAPLATEAQQAAKIARIGYLSLDAATSAGTREAFLQGLRDLGYVEGRNLLIEYRDAEGKPERLPALAAELVALKVCHPGRRHTPCPGRQASDPDPPHCLRCCRAGF